MDILIATNYLCLGLLQYRCFFQCNSFNLVVLFSLWLSKHTTKLSVITVWRPGFTCVYCSAATIYGAKTDRKSAQWLVGTKFSLFKNLSFKQRLILLLQFQLGEQLQGRSTNNGRRDAVHTLKYLTY